ncbi:MAG: copper-binding protein [Variibacter sp.]|nr:copper-binding protein [Variibacter sp.]
MKTFLRVLAMLAAMGAAAQTATAQSDLVDGQVTKVDAAAGKITIRHGPLKKFDMDEAMTMVFRVRDPAMLKTVKAGDKVKFDVDRIDGQFTITRMQKAQ